MIRAEPQPHALPSTSASTSAVRPTVIVAMPGMSTDCAAVSSRDSCVANSVTTTASGGHGQVEEEDRAPGDVLGQQAADDRADRQRERRDAGPGADRLAALVRREGVGDDRERGGHHERGADALDGAAGDEPGLARGRGRWRRSTRRTTTTPNRNMRAPAEDVAEAAAGDEQDGEASACRR